MNHHPNHPVFRFRMKEVSHHRNIHHHCLETYMSNPPFDDTCHVCGAQINHHRFSDTREQLEKRWAQKQARQREIQDLEDLFGM